MAIVKEFYKERTDGVKLYITYSDEDYLIKKVGTEEIYDAAIDIEDNDFDYIETDEKKLIIEEEVLNDGSIEV